MSTPAGHASAPLPKKLGIKKGHAIGLSGAPASFERTLGALPEGARLVELSRGKAPFPVIVLFVTRRADLEERFARAVKRLDPSGGLWVAWPKQASGVETDVTKDVVREVALAAGLVDNKVCAIDAMWSGLQCVVRLKDRPTHGPPIEKP